MHTARGRLDRTLAFVRTTLAAAHNVIVLYKRAQWPNERSEIVYTIIVFSVTCVDVYVFTYESLTLRAVRYLHVIYVYIQCFSSH